MCLVHGRTLRGTASSLVSTLSEWAFFRHGGHVLSSSPPPPFILYVGFMIAPEMTDEWGFHSWRVTYKWVVKNTADDFHKRQTAEWWTWYYNAEPNERTAFSY